MSTLTLTILLNISGSAFGLPQGLLTSLCYVESGHKVSAVHKDDGGQDSLGLCQLHLTTARLMGFKGTRKQLMDPVVNMYYAAKYLAHQVKRYHGDLTSAVIAYNIGSSRHLKVTSYSRKVFAQWHKTVRIASR